MDGGNGFPAIPGLRDDDEAKFGVIRGPEARFPHTARAIDEIHLQEAAVVITDIEVIELLVVSQHRCQHDVQPRIIPDISLLNRGQSPKDIETVARGLEPGIDAIGRELRHRVEKRAGGGTRDRGDPDEAEIDQRQTDEQDNADEQRDDRCSEADVEAWFGRHWHRLLLPAGVALRGRPCTKRPPSIPAASCPPPSRPFASGLSRRSIELAAH